MQKRRTIAATIVVCLLGMIGCTESDHKSHSGQGRANDDSAYVDLNLRYIEAVNAYVDDFSAVDDAEAAAAAVHAFAGKLESIVADGEKLRAMDAGGTLQSEPSEALLIATEEAEAVSERLAPAMIRSMAFMANPKMAAAMQRLERVMAAHRE